MLAPAGSRSGTKLDHYAPAWLAATGERSRHRSLLERILRDATALMRRLFDHVKRLISERPRFFS
jgi:hypothetical protein